MEIREANPACNIPLIHLPISTSFFFHGGAVLGLDDFFGNVD